MSMAGTRIMGKENSGGAGEWLYRIAFAALCLKYIVFFSRIVNNPKILGDLLTALALGCIVIKLCIQHYTAKRIVLTAALTIAVVFSCIQAGNIVYMLSFLFVIAMQDVDIAKVLKLGSFIKISSIIIHVAWYIVLLMTNPFSIEYVYRNGVKRHFFLLGHANAFTALLIWTFLEIIYIYYSRIKGVHLFLLWLVSWIFYYYTDSNTGIIVFSLVILLIVCDRYRNRLFDKIATPLARYGYLACAVLFSALVVIYPQLSGQAKSMWDTFDDFLTGRLLYGAYAYDTYGASLLGRIISYPPKIYWNGLWFDPGQYFDNYYVGYFISLGIMHLIIKSLALFWLAGKAENREKIMVIAFIFYGTMESYVSNVAICFALLLVGKYLYRTEKEPQPDRCKPDDRGTEEGEMPLWKRRRSVS